MLSVVTILLHWVVLKLGCLSLIQIILDKQVILLQSPLRNRRLALPNGLSCATFLSARSFGRTCPGKRNGRTKALNRSICCRRKRSFLDAPPQCSRCGDWQRGSAPLMSLCC